MKITKKYVINIGYNRIEKTLKLPTFFAILYNSTTKSIYKNTKILNNIKSKLIEYFIIFINVEI